jgi:hypothetical protein
MSDSHTGKIKGPMKDEHKQSLSRSLIGRKKKKPVSQLRLFSQ